MRHPRREASPSRDVEPHLTDVARGGVLNFLGIVASTLFGFALVVIVTRGFTSTQVGLFFETVALFNLALSVAVWGADVGLVRTIPRVQLLDRNADVGAVVRSVITTVSWIALPIAAVIVVFAPQLSGLLTRGVDRGAIEPLIRASALFVPVAAVYTLLLATMRGLGRMGPPNVVDRLGRAGSQPIIASLVAVFGMGSVALIVGWSLPYAIGSAVAALWVALMLRQSSSTVGKETAAIAHRRELLVDFWRFVLPRGLATVFAVTVLWLDTLLVGALESTQDAGVYAAATRYLAFGAFASQAVIQAIGPTMSVLLTRDDTRTARSVYRAGTAWGVIVGWPVYLMLAIFAPAVLSILGPGYGQAQDALTILALTMLVASGVGPVDIVLLMAGKSTWNLLNTVVALVLNVTLNVVLIPRFGITGAAIAWSASILTNNLLPLVQLRAFLGLHPLGSETISAAAVSIVAFGLIPVAIREVFSASVPAMLVAAVLAIGVYLAALWRFRGVLKIDRLFAFRARGPVARNTEGVPISAWDV